jgi:hypothetical protein
MALKITPKVKKWGIPKALKQELTNKKNGTFNDTNNPFKIFLYDLYLLHNELHQNTASYPPLKPLHIYHSTCH